MLQAVQDLNQMLDSENKISVRIGIATGSLVGGVIGTTRMQFDVWGQTVNRASRIESCARPGIVTVCSHTAALIVSLFSVVDVGKQNLKGIGEEHVFELGHLMKNE